jgi:biopolymer transport protein ExbD
VTADGKLFLGKKPIEKTDLKAEIDKKMEGKAADERIVYIRSDVGADYGKVVDTINTIRESGIDQIGLVADKKKGAPDTPAPAAS